MTFNRSYFYLVAIISGVLTIVVSVLLYAYYQGLHPKLVCEFRLDSIRERCPEIDDWVKKREVWEDVPTEMVEKLYNTPVSDSKCLFASYEKQIVRFKPYSFHSVKGAVETLPGACKTIYVYVCDKRYAPLVFGP